MPPLDFRTKLPAAGAFMAGLFWIWGALGLAGGSYIFLTLPGSVGVGTSAYISAGLLHWIGGMVFFGLGALLCGPIIEHAADPEDLADKPPQ